jgi:integrase
MDSEQARRFLASAREDHDPYYAAYVLVLIGGLRKGEVLGMTTDAADFDRLTVRIEHQLQRVRRDLHTEEPRHYGRDWTNARDQAAASKAWQNSGLLFTTRYGTPIEPRNFDPLLALSDHPGRCPADHGARRPADVRGVAG